MVKVLEIDTRDKEGGEEFAGECEIEETKDKEEREGGCKKKEN